MRAWIVVAVLVVAIAALGAWQVLQQAQDESNLSENAVELKLDIEKTQYHLGENIGVTLSVKNKLDHEVTLAFPSSQMFDLVVYDENLVKVCAWSDDKAFLDVITSVTLGRGETHSELMIWGQKIYDRQTGEYASVKPGTYYLEGHLVGGWFENFEGPPREEMQTSRLTIVISP